MARKARKPAPADETKGQKFVRLAKVRMTALVKSARLVGQLSSSGYESTPAQVAQMKKAASEALTDAFAKFDKSARDDAGAFDFSAE